MGKYAVITGASSGLGVEFAKCLSQKGYKLILVARREERLRKLADHLKSECEIISADLTDEAECYRVWKTIKNREIEIFINNAGFGDCGCFTETDLDKELDMVQLNVKAVHIFSKLALRKMQEKNEGYILNVASCTGLMPGGPYMATYYATKAYVTSLTRGIAEELKESGSDVYVGCLCPGPVATDFNKVANVKFTLPEITSEHCVKYALKQMWKRKVVIIPTIQMKIAMTLGRYISQSLYVKIAGNQQEKDI